MSIVSIIIFVFILAKIVASVSKSSEGNKTNTFSESDYIPSTNLPASNTAENDVAQELALRAIRMSEEKKAAGAKAQTAAYTREKKMEQSQANEMTKTKQQNSDLEKGEKPVEKKKSTTEILSEKAREDQIAHQQEKREHDVEERKRHGKINYAGRHYPGDPIPNGMREVVCSYCNAENLVSAHDYTTKYNCYFCRELL